MTLLRGSRQIQIIALIISFGSLGAALLDQQVNMAAEVFKGAGQADSIGAFLAQIRFYTSAAAFVIQVWITPRIHRYLGIGFALLILPTNLSITAAIILLNNALWAPALARVTDQSFRYRGQDHARGALPPAAVRAAAGSEAAGGRHRGPMARAWRAADPRPHPALGTGAGVESVEHREPRARAVWFVMAVRAKREYLASFRRSIEQRIVQPEQVRLDAADLSTVETLVQELANPMPIG